MHRSDPGSAAPPENTVSCPHSAPAQQRLRSQGAEAGAAVGVGVGVGTHGEPAELQSELRLPTSRADPQPHPTPGRESREEPARPKMKAKVRRELPLTSPGSPGLLDTRMALPSVLLGSVTRTPVPEAEPGQACFPRQREACSRTAGQGQPGSGGPA